MGEGGRGGEGPSGSPGLLAGSLLATLLLTVLTACGPAPDPTSRDAPAPPVAAASTTDADALRTTARRLAGLDDAGGTALWSEHRTAMESIWVELEARHLGPMRSWGERSFTEIGNPRATLFYPFGGPDLLSAAQFFPAASSYVLVGLEPPGRIPNLDDFDRLTLAAELARLRGGLQHLVDAGYFVTTQMERDFADAAHRLDGFLPVLYLFLAREGQVPTAVRYVTLDAGGELRIPAAVTAEEATAVAIDFRAGGGGGAAPAATRTLYYFAQDLSDEGLAAAPGLLRFLGRREGFNVYLKSASYLLHMPGFATVRDFILESGHTILQDDSGVPLRDFPRERFDVRFFGTYEQTLPAYRQWFQEDLEAIYAAQDIEPLAFAIGYHSQIGGSCLIWAERRPAAAGRPDPGRPDPGWPQFRGPTGDGMAPDADLPLTWSEGEHVAWKTPIAGRGFSSPVIGDGKVWLTTAGDEERTLRAVGIDLESGDILNDVEVFRPPAWHRIHAENSYASPTPVLEEGRVYVHFGAYGTACLDAADGRALWKTEAFDLDHEHGPGSSPVLYRHLLIVHFDGSDERFVAAFDKATGELEWKATRSVELEHYQYAFSTPLLIEHGGAPQLVSPGAGQVSAYNPLDGEEIWRVRHGGHSGVPRPVAGLGRVFVDTGYMKPHLLAIDPGGRGDVTDSHVAWSYHWQVPANPSPLLIGERLFFTSDWGIATWLDAASAEEVWRQRLGGRHYASPIYARGRIYTFSTEGETRVIAAADEFRELATNRLAGGFRASPAVAGDALIVRTESHLYRIEEGNS